MFLTPGAKLLPKTKDSTKQLKRVVSLDLLDKFILDALHLTTNRLSLNQRYQHSIGALSAGVAILIYLFLFAWLGTVFVINSLPFMLIAALFYILKDRVKESLRAVSFQQASRWFPDYTTIIQPLGGRRSLGVIKESFSFIEQHQLPEEIKTVRNAKFHAVLETFQRPGKSMFIKRSIEINNPPKSASRAVQVLISSFGLTSIDFCSRPAILRNRVLISKQQPTSCTAPACQKSIILI